MTLRKVLYIFLLRLVRDYSINTDGILNPLGEIQGEPPLLVFEDRRCEELQKMLKKRRALPACRTPDVTLTVRVTPI
jgi:hypothetical protein